MKKIHDWYYDRIPLDSWRFTQFLSNAAELGHEEITTYHPTGRQYPCVVSHRAAYIPSAYFGPNFSGTEKDGRALTTALWNNGIRTIKELVSLYAGYNRLPFNDELDFAAFTNLLYANERVAESKFGIFNQTANSFLYQRDTLAAAILDQDRHRIAEHYLNPELREDVKEILGDDVADVLAAITKKYNRGRLEPLSHQLYELLKEETDDESDCESDQDDENQQQGGESQQNNAPDGEGDQGGLGAGWLDQNPDAQPTANPLPYQASPQAVEEATAATQSLNDEIQSYQGGGWDKLTDLANEVVFMDILDAPKDRRPTPIEASDTLSQLGRLLRQVKVVNEPPMVPQRRGFELLEDELYRFNIDGKVMGIPDEIVETADKEFIISCDLSDSTNWCDYRQRYGKNLWQIELEDAKGAFIALKNAREKVSVYAHTTFGGSIVLYKVADNRSTQLNQRFDAVSTIDNGANYDQHILMWYAQHGFKSPETKKFILMLSDGKPCGTNGEDDTKRVVNELRTRDITVISFSLVPSVIENNNYIYGEAWNIDASQDLKSSMKQVLLAINTRR